MSLTGIHINDFEMIPKYHKKTGVSFFQFFVTPVKNYKNEFPLTVRYIKKNKIRTVVHSSYSINLARPWDSTEWKIQQLINEIMICDQIGAYGIVIHTGKSLNLDIREAINNMYTSLLYIHQQTLKYSDVKILMETPSGQGTETLTDIGEFCKFMNKFYTHPKDHVKQRFGVCIDTCHIYAAGYNISDKTVTDRYFNYLNKKIGLDKIKLVHINDSKQPLGSKKDRHENLGVGTIGLSGLKRLIKFFASLEIPMMTETPDTDSNHNMLKDYQYINQITT